MRMRSAVSMLAAIFLVSGAAAADQRRPAANREKVAIQYTGEPTVRLTPDQIERIRQYPMIRTALAGPRHDCKYQAGGVCPIEIQVELVTAAGKEYCVAPFPKEIHLGEGDNLQKTIVWKLLRPSNAPASSTFTFFDDAKSVHKAHGIIVLSDGKKQLKNGRLGDGASGPADPTKWLIEHKFQKNAKNTAVYLPLIVRTDQPGTADKELAVCGTPDPRIAND